MKGNSLISIEDLTKDDILEILDRAAEFEKNPNQDLLKGKVAGVTVITTVETKGNLPAGT